jgi:hypothetical protein
MDLVRKQDGMEATHFLFGLLFHRHRLLFRTRRKNEPRDMGHRIFCVLRVSSVQNLFLGLHRFLNIFFRKSTKRTFAFLHWTKPKRCLGRGEFRATSAAFNSIHNKPLHFIYIQRVPWGKLSRYPAGLILTNSEFFLNSTKFVDPQ